MGFSIDIKIGIADCDAKPAEKNTYYKRIIYFHLEIRLIAMTRIRKAQKPMNCFRQLDPENLFYPS